MMLKAVTRRWTAASLLLGVVATALFVAGCESYVRAKAFEQHAPLREGSLAWWIPRTIENQEAIAWLVPRASVIVGRADHVGLDHDGNRTLSLKPMRAGQPASPTLGSAVAVSFDGYFVTAAHCVNDEPYVIVACNSYGNYVERMGRTVWSGMANGGRTDVALVHAPELMTVPVEWCMLTQAGGGTRVLSAGVGVGASRFAAGQITGGPTGIREAAAGRALSFHVDSPLIPGDSGGPTILEDGTLLGISASVEIEIFTRPGGGEVLRPNPEFIRELIDSDRARQSTGKLAP